MIFLKINKQYLFYEKAIGTLLNIKIWEMGEMVDLSRKFKSE